MNSQCPRTSVSRCILTLRPKVLDADIPVLDIAGFIQAAAEGGNEMSERRG
jgi:hypothetical protein